MPSEEARSYLNPPCRRASRRGATDTHDQADCRARDHAAPLAASSCFVAELVPPNANFRLRENSTFTCSDKCGTGGPLRCSAVCGDFNAEVHIPSAADVARQQAAARQQPLETSALLATMTRQPCLLSSTTASDMRAARLAESNSSSEMSQLRSTLEMRFLAMRHLGRRRNSMTLDERVGRALIHGPELSRTH
jgi:hypothetical protein